jgi:hypothetical protein
MRLIGAASLGFLLVSAFVFLVLTPGTAATDVEGSPREARERSHRTIFRYDTFGDEQLWTDVLRMHEVIATVPPSTALAVASK